MNNKWREEKAFFFNHEMPTNEYEIKVELENHFGNQNNNKNSAKKHEAGTSLVVQWLELLTSNAGGRGSVPGRGTRTPHAARRGQNIKKKKKKHERMFK